MGVQSYRHRAGSTSVDSSPYALNPFFATGWHDLFFRGAQHPLLLQPHWEQQSWAPFEKLTPSLEMSLTGVPGCSHLHGRRGVQISALERGLPGGGQHQQLTSGSGTWVFATRSEHCMYRPPTVTGVGVWVQSIIFPPKAQINANFTLRFSC